jgi:hypothetical protein
MGNAAYLSDAIRAQGGTGTSTGLLPPSLTWQYCIACTKYDNAGE